MREREREREVSVGRPLKNESRISYSHSLREGEREREVSVGRPLKNENRISSWMIAGSWYSRKPASTAASTSVAIRRNL